VLNQCQGYMKTLGTCYVLISYHQCANLLFANVLPAMLHIYYYIFLLITATRTVL